MREGPDFVLRFTAYGLVVVVVLIVVSVGLFWLLKRHSLREAQKADARARARRENP